MLNKKKLVLAYIVFIGKICLGQDLIFSQYFASQPYLNPALTGFFDGSYRVNAQYRNQWTNVGSGINSYGVNADAKMFENDKGDYMGVGLNSYRDDRGLIVNTLGNINLSYTKKLGYEMGHYLSIGTNFGLNSDGLNTSSTLIFPDQIPESFERKSVTNFNLGLGANYQLVSDGGYANLFFGASVDHLISMKNSFFNNNVEREKRINLYTSAKLNFAENFYIIPTILTSFQGAHRQINTGVSGQYLFRDYSKNKSSLITGIYTRFGNNAIDAIIGTFRYEYRGMSIGASYDLNVNELNLATKGFGAFEISLGFIGLIERYNPARMNCPSIKNF